MSIQPYLHFRGQCREAMSFYHAILGGTIELMGFADLPNAPPGAAESDRVMHANIESPHGKLLASDYPPGSAGHPQQAVTVSLLVDDAAEGQRIFDRLAEGAEITEPYAQNFFSPGFGMLTDRFGTHWMIVTNRPA